MSAHPTAWRRRLDQHGMLLVLLVLCATLSLLTLERQPARDPESGRAMVAELAQRVPQPAVFLAADRSAEYDDFTRAVREAVEEGGGRILAEVRGDPREVRRALEATLAEGGRPQAILSVRTCDAWALLEAAPARYPELAGAQVRSPAPRMQSTFLSRRNLLNVSEKIVVWAVIAIGVTLVILTAGIDLSVGSLVALSSVVCALLVQRVFGGAEAGGGQVALAFLGGIGAAGVVGLITGLLVTRLRVAPFIVTLGMMMAASGLALRLTNGRSVDEVPARFGWLGHGEVLGLPNSVLLMAALYLGAHLVMAHTALGRAIYAVGGNPEAARLAGVPVARVLVFVYVLSGLLAGVGGVLTASIFESGNPNYGQTYELYVIAAVVVGGTSLSGGQGRVMGTLVGALILGVIYNGMNLLDVGAFSQRIVLGAVILLAVVLDRLKRR